MSPRPLLPGPGPAADEDELVRFRAWLAGRGYAETTGRLWANRVRSAHASSVVTADEVDAVFGALSQATRGALRAALREFDEFRRAR